MLFNSTTSSSPSSLGTTSEPHILRRTSAYIDLRKLLDGQTRLSFSPALLQSKTPSPPPTSPPTPPQLPTTPEEDKDFLVGQLTGPASPLEYSPSFNVGELLKRLKELECYGREIELPGYGSRFLEEDEGEDGGRELGTSGDDSEDNSEEYDEGVVIEMDDGERVWGIKVYKERGV